MKRLQGTLEMLDGPLDEHLLAGNLRDLARVNRFLGGRDLSWRAVRWVAQQHRARVLGLLDVGTGAADIPASLLDRAAADGLALEITATDVRDEIVGIARARTRGMPRLSVSLASTNDMAPHAFDIVHASLVLHHLEPDAAVDRLRSMARACRLAVVINDLDRARRWWLAAWLMTRLATTNRYTRHDAPLSVRRAYTPDEVADMGGAAGLREALRLKGPLGHRYTLVLVPEDRESGVAE